LIVPGQLLSAPFPSHVMLDTQAGLILWQAASADWVLKRSVTGSLKFE
jgi:hypothetical protein